MEVLTEENLAENAYKMGQLFRTEIKKVKSLMIEDVRGKGLLNAVQIRPSKGKKAWDLCIKMKDNGILAKPTHEHTIRFTPPLIINETQMMEAIDLIKKSFSEIE
jgi:ornithine--oxo-acid transaminase